MPRSGAHARLLISVTSWAAAAGIVNSHSSPALFVWANRTVLFISQFLTRFFLFFFKGETGINLLNQLRLDSRTQRRDETEWAEGRVLLPRAEGEVEEDPGRDFGPVHWGGVEREGRKLRLKD